MPGTQQILYPDSYLCECADNFISCNAAKYMQYFRFKIGSTPNIDEILKVDKLRRIVCDGGCGLCADDIDKLKQELNKIIS